MSPAYRRAFSSRLTLCKSTPWTGQFVWGKAIFLAFTSVCCRLLCCPGRRVSSAACFFFTPSDCLVFFETRQLEQGLSRSITWPVFSYKLRYIVGFGLVEIAMATDSAPVVKNPETAPLRGCPIAKSHVACAMDMATAGGRFRVTPVPRISHLDLILIDPYKVSELFLQSVICLWQFGIGESETAFLVTWQAQRCLSRDQKSRAKTRMWHAVQEDGAKLNQRQRGSQCPVNSWQAVAGRRVPV